MGYERLWLALVVLPPLVRGGETPVVTLGALFAIGPVFALWLRDRLAQARPVTAALAAPLALGLVWATAATWTSAHRVTSLWELAWWLGLGALFRVTAAELPGTAGLIRLQGALIATATLISAYGLVETYALDDRVLGHAKTAYRGQVSGTFVNPSHMSSYLVLALPAALAAASAARGAHVRATAAVAATIIAAAIVLSRSRGGWIATALGIAVLAVFSARARAVGRLVVVLSVVGGVVALGLAATPGVLPALAKRLATLPPGLARDQDAFGRAGPWGAAWELMRERPVTGWGPGTFAHAFLAVRPPGYYYRPSHAHQEPLELGVELGFPGFLAALALAAAAAWRAVRVSTRLPTEARLPHAALVAGGAAFLSTCLWDWPLRVPSTALAFAVMLGALAAPTSQPPESAPHARALSAVAAAAWIVLLVPLGGRFRAELGLVEARALARAGETERACAVYADVRARWPSLWSAALEEVQVAERRTDAAARAQAALAALSAVRAAPAHADTWRALGGALVFLGDYALAAEAYGESARLDPANHLPHLEHANVLWAAGRHDDAMGSYRAALDAYPVERIGEFPEIVRQMTPVAAALAARDPHALAPADLAHAVRLLELRKARAPRDFRSYRLLQELYHNLGLVHEEQAEAAAEARAVRGP